MPAVVDVQHRLVDELGPAVAARERPARPAPPARRAGASTSAGLQQPRRLRRHPVAQRQEQLVLAARWLVSSARQHLLLVLLQLGRDVALGVLERLLADVVGRDLASAVGVGDLDVVAEDLVEADLQAGDAGAADLLGLEAGDPLLAAAGDLAQLVELGVVAVADQAAFLGGQRRVVDQGRVERRADLGAELERGLRARASSCDAAGRQPGLELGQQRAASAPGRPGRAAWPGRC